MLVYLLKIKHWSHGLKSFCYYSSVKSSISSSVKIHYTYDYSFECLWNLSQTIKKIISSYLTLLLNEFPNIVELNFARILDLNSLFSLSAEYLKLGLEFKDFIWSLLILYKNFSSISWHMLRYKRSDSFLGFKKLLANILV